MEKTGYLLLALCFFVIALSLRFIFFHKAQAPKISKLPFVETYQNCVTKPAELHDKGLCLKDFAAYAAVNYSVPEVDSDIASITDPKQLQWCHEFMHYFGWGLYDKTKDLYSAFSLASGTCDSGMYHGIVEQYIKQANLNYDNSGFVTAIVNACNDGISKRSLPVAMQGICYHGLGHGFMFITENDLPKSLAMCDYLQNGLEKPCYTGAFMENVQSKQVGREASHPSKFSFNQNDPDYPCNTLEDKYKSYCYNYKGVSVVVLTQGDFEKAFNSCLKIDAKYRKNCFWGVGSDIPAPSLTTVQAAQKCDFALSSGTEAYSECVLGGMSFVVELNLGKAQAAADYCSAINPDYKNICYKAAGSSLTSWLSGDETLSQKCAVFTDPKAQQLCLQHD